MPLQFHGERYPITQTSRHPDSLKPNFIEWGILTVIACMQIVITILSLVMHDLAHWIAFLHDDVIEWKHFPRYRPFARGIHRVPGEFSAQRPVTRSFDVFLDLRLNIRLSKQSWGWWFETLSRPLWRQCNIINTTVNPDESGSYKDKFYIHSINFTSFYNFK